MRVVALLINKVHSFPIFITGITITYQRYMDALNLLKTQESSLLKYIDDESDLFVVGMKGLEYLQGKGQYNEFLQPLNITAEWARDFLCNPHAELGRKGAVCPFTKPAIEKELFWLSLYSKPVSKSSDISDIMIRYRDLFFQIEPSTGKEAQYKTILVIFPQVKQEDCKFLIDDVQEQLKPEFVSKGLMIGQFYANCQQPGLWNPDFKPLQSPLPMLVIRNMVISDYPFLEHDKNLIQSWVSLFASSYLTYLNKYKSLKI